MSAGDCSRGSTAGYVYLSHPESALAVLVEPDGRIWQSDDGIEWCPRTRAVGRILLDLSKDLADEEFGRWNRSWLEGYLPVLILSPPRQDEELRLAVHRDRLWISSSPALSMKFQTADPTAVKVVSPEIFDRAIEEIGAYWRKWFEGSWSVPEDSPVSDHVVRSCFVQARCAYVGRRPKYGAAYYARPEHDGFPPTTLAMVDGLIDYNLHNEARDLFGYFAETFITSDGRIDYYGPSISEYGQLLALARKMADIPQGREWCQAYLPKFHRLTDTLIRWIDEADNEYGLIAGVPEADQTHRAGVYFHNNAWAWRGFLEFAGLLRQFGRHDQVEVLVRRAEELADRLSRAIEATRVFVPGVGYCVAGRPDTVEFNPHFSSSEYATYLNYRYYPELLESGFLSREDADKLIRWRLTYGGDFAGTTVFGFPEVRLDDWTLASYGRALLRSGRKELYMVSLLGHTYSYLSNDTYTAYEQISLADFPRIPYADFSVPCQLATSRMIRWWYNPELASFKEIS